MSEQPLEPPQRFDVCQNCGTAAEPDDRRCRRCGRTLSKVTIGAGKHSSTELVPSSSTSAEIDELSATVDSLHATVSTALAALDEVNRQYESPPEQQFQQPFEQPVGHQIVGGTWLDRFDLKLAIFEPKYLQFCKRVSKLCLMAILAGIMLGVGAPTGPREVAATVLALGGLLMLFVFWVPYWLIIIHLGIADGFNSLKVASQPIPSAAEIGWQLTQEWGRPATVQEVAAVQQMLVSEKNQHLLNAGMALGGIYLLHNAANHR